MTAWQKVIGLALGAACTALFLSGTSWTEANLADSFPMQEGTTWTYRGIVRWYDMEAQKRVTSKVESRSQVSSVLQRDGFAAALVHGFPSDFDWSDGAADPSDVLVVRTRDGHMYFSNDENVQDNFRKLGAAPESLKGMFDIGDFWMKLPLKKGMKFCDDEARKRPDDAYCWVVATSHEVSLDGVRGIRSGSYPSFLVQYVTNPDDTEFEFVPGVGFISYRYHHHGSVADTEMTLVEYHVPDVTESKGGGKR